MYFAVWASDKPGVLATRVALREAHRARLREPRGHAVKVVLGGPTLGEAVADPAAAMNGSLLVIEADHIDAVHDFLAGDPYVLAGLYASIEVRPWVWGIGLAVTPAPPAQQP